MLKSGEELLLFPSEHYAWQKMLSEGEAMFIYCLFKPSSYFCTALMPNFFWYCILGHRYLATHTVYSWLSREQLTIDHFSLPPWFHSRNCWQMGMNNLAHVIKAWFTSEKTPDTILILNKDNVWFTLLKMYVTSLTTVGKTINH